LIVDIWPVSCRRARTRAPSPAPRQRHTNLIDCGKH
jgi:hypothetical protein